VSRRFLLVGLTGGLATGKSTVSEILRGLGCVVLDADVITGEGDSTFIADGNVEMVRQDLVAALPDSLREAQGAFAATGGLHATGLFDSSGELLCVREDVGRHNAMDKVVGWAFAEGLLPLASHVLCVSGRLSFELVQKAAVAGCPVLVAVGAPSSLAVELAEDRGVTLCGWVRDGRVTVYSEPWRIV